MSAGPHDKAAATLTALFGDPRVSVSGVAVDVLREVADEDRSPGLMDRLIHADVERVGANLHPFDRQAARLPGVTPVT